MAIDYEKGMRPNLYQLMQEGGGGGSYVLPPATENTLGGVKIGEGVSVESDGTISVNAETPENVLVNTDMNEVFDYFGLYAQSDTGNSYIELFDTGLYLKHFIGSKGLELNLADNGLELYSYDEDSYYPNPLPVIFNIASDFSLNADGGVTITNVVDPTLNSDAANKGYVDDSIAAIQPEFMRLDFNQALTNMRLLPVTDDTVPTSTTGRVDITLPAEYQTDWAIVGVVKYECKNGNTRVDAIRVYEFTMSTQTVMRLGLKTSGTTAKEIDNIAGALLLIRRS